MTREHALFQAIQRTMKAAKTLDEAKLLFHDAIAEIYPFDFELEIAAADKQREWDWKADREKEAKVGA